MRLSDCQCSTTTAATNYSILPILFIFFILVAICIKEANADKVDQCCRSHGIPDVCVQKLCYPLRPPGDFDVYDIFNSKNNCTKFLPQIAQCLADGRDHSDCCNSEAKDSEQNACFGLCKGVGKNRSSWHNYQSCLAINLPNMFICLQKGYVKTPTPPQNLRLDQIEISSVVIQWEEPEFNVDQVDHYQVVISEQVVSDATSTTTPSYNEDELDEEMGESEEKEEEKPLYRPKVIELDIGRETSVKVENLQPGTLYNAYVIAVGNNPTERSLSSDMLDFQTVGISPQIFPYKKVVNAPNGAKSAVVACRFHMSSISYKTANIQWQHKSAEGGTYKTLINSDRHNMTDYIWSYERPREYIMSMEINQLSSSDFGFYRCSIQDNFGAAATEVQLAVASLTTASSTPPDTPIECCKGRGVENRCLSMCGGVAENADIKRFSPRPFMPFNCSTQISKVLSCAMPGIDDSECCLRRNVPRSCIYLCDSSVVPENHMDPLCLRYTLSVESCRVGGVDQRPSSVLGLKAQSNVGANSIAIQWDPSTSAEIYHIYWRRNRNSDWQQKSSVGTSKKIQGGAEEIVLVAANVYGISQASRLTLNNSKWIPS